MPYAHKDTAAETHPAAGGASEGQDRRQLRLGGQYDWPWECSQLTTSTGSQIEKHQTIIIGYLNDGDCIFL